MPSSPGGDYLETEVLTAPPQKLQLMLIEGVIRRAERARLHWKAGENNRASEELIRGQQIVTELIGGLNREANPELVKRIAAVYLFAFRGLLDASVGQDEEKLDEAIRVLEVERQTWRRVCRELGNSEPADTAAGSFSVEA